MLSRIFRETENAAVSRKRQIDTLKIFNDKYVPYHNHQSFYFFATARQSGVTSKTNMKDVMTVLYLLTIYLVVWLALLPSFTAWLTLLVRSPIFNLTPKKPVFY